MNKRLSFLLLLATATLLLFLNLGKLGLTDWEEGTHAEAAREMIENGDWMTPTLNGEPRFEQPVFTYWLMNGAYRLLGVSELSARIPSAVGMAALVLLQYWFLTSTRGAFIGLVGSLMLLLNIEMVAIGRMAWTDSVLIFFTTASLFGFWVGLHGEGKQRHAFWFFYVGMAIGMLTKGPIGVVVPLLGAVPYLFVTHRWKQFWENGFPILGLLIVALLTCPWYGAMLWIHGSGYATSKADTIGRFFTRMGAPGGTIFFYLPALLLGFFPWSGFLPAALLDAWKDCRQTRRSTPTINNRNPGSQELELFAALWLIWVFLFFSLSATQLPHNIGALFPAAAILSALYWTRCMKDPETRGLRASLWTLMLLGCALGLVLIASPLLHSTYNESITKEFPAATAIEPGVGSTAAGFVLIFGVGIVGYFGLAEHRRPGAFWAAAATIIVVIMIAIVITLPHFSKYFIDPPHELAYIAGVNLQPSDHFLIYGTPKPSMLFYAKRRAVMIEPGEEDEMKPHLAGPGRTMILLPSRLKSQLPAEAAGFSPILERYGYTLLANEPMVKLPPKPMSQPTIPPNPHGL
ncbi:MAG TPA: glycosyltransferase family 39 protein [Nitrospiraceae bacterium]|nr:glycosyltransferase family 39 protein [Nitrospiraceae bacterium]